MKPRTKAGALILAGSVQFLVLMIIAETQYPGYSPADNYISDLGLWDFDSALIFNPSVSIFGLLGATGSIILFRSTDWRWFLAFLFLSGVGAFGVGIFNEDFEGLHFVVSAMAFGFAALAAISSYWYLPRRVSIPGLVLGSVSLAAMGLYGTDIFLGLGPGGMERMIFYPVIGWMLIMSGYLIASDDFEEK